MMKTIYQASNDTSVLYFEDQEDAQKYAGSCGVCSGVIVSPVTIIPKSHEGLEPLDGITPKDLKWKYSGENYMDDETRPEGHYKISNRKAKSIGCWTKGKFWQIIGDECDFSSEELSLISIEPI